MVIITTDKRHPSKACLLTNRRQLHQMINSYSHIYANNPFTRTTHSSSAPLFEMFVGELSIYYVWRMLVYDLRMKKRSNRYIIWFCSVIISPVLAKMVFFPPRCPSSLLLLSSVLMWATCATPSNLFDAKQKNLCRICIPSIWQRCW
jgi:hypothetical protein